MISIDSPTGRFRAVLRECDGGTEVAVYDRWHGIQDKGGPKQHVGKLVQKAVFSEPFHVVRDKTHDLMREMVE